MKKCKSCQKEIDEKAKKCPHCQTDQRNWFVRHKITSVILALIVLGIIGAATGGNKGSSTSTSTVSSGGGNTQQEQPTVAPKALVVDATDLVKEYDKNKLAAQDKYTGKEVQTKAFISNISNDITGSYYLSLKPSNEQYYVGTTLTCYFSDKSALTSLSKGQEVTVQGKMEDMSLGIVAIKDCSLVE